jgi:hypothetical protein
MTFNATVSTVTATVNLHKGGRVSVEFNSGSSFVSRDKVADVVRRLGLRKGRAVAVTGRAFWSFDDRNWSKDTVSFFMGNDDVSLVDRFTLSTTKGV